MNCQWQLAECVLMPMALFIFLASACMKLFLSNKLNHIWHLLGRQLDVPLEAHHRTDCVTVYDDFNSAKQDRNEPKWKIRLNKFIALSLDSWKWILTI